jgi:hypothetical protein
MGHLEGNFTPVLYIGRKVPKGYEGSLTSALYIKTIFLDCFPLLTWRAKEQKKNTKCHLTVTLVYLQLNRFLYKFYFNKKTAYCSRHVKNYIFRANYPIKYLQELC